MLLQKKSVKHSMMLNNMCKSLRKDKIIKDTDEDGNPKTSVPRIGMPIPNFIVEQRIGFMVSKHVQYNMFANAIGEKLIEATKDIMRRTRMEFSNKDVLRACPRWC